ncbi:MAG: dihydrolipoyl dehydrogenase, partial [Flavobacterium sp.]|nr:dihydrolipoyl dehydrogenase [Flavobacterium sp.]
AIIEKYSTLGGTCLNVGCIPSKALLASSHHYEELQHFADHGIEVSGDVKVNLEKMIARKQAVVDQTSGGVKFLMDKNNITVFNGVGSFESATSVKVTKEDGSSEIIESKNIIIATGSKPSSLPFIKLYKDRIITSTEALKLKEVPKHLVIIGGGVIGIELGQVYLRLGAQVSVVEFMDRIIPGMDAALSKELTKVLKKQGMKFYTSHKVQSVERAGDVVTVKAENAKGEIITLEGDYSLVSVGRRPYTDGLNAEKAGVKVTERGQIEVNDHLQTSASNIYAIGDVVRGAMLAHKAEEEGVMVAEILAGQKPHIDYNLIPGVVYTWPEVAAVGKTEEQLKAEGVAYKAGSFPFKALGRARAGGDTDGFVKILADAKTDEVLGVHMIGARCADLIAEAVTAMEFRASAEDISRMSHAHPTFAEAIKEAALAATDNRALHV